MPAIGGGRRRRREPGGRPHKLTVRLTEEEARLVGARAAAAGLTPASFLAAAGMASGESAGSGGETVAWRTSAAAELLAVVRQCRGMAANINQMAAYAHTHDGRMHQKLGEALAAVEAAAGRAAAVAKRLDPRMPQ
jgi:hypothetical protein